MDITIRYSNKDSFTINIGDEKNIGLIRKQVEEYCEDKEVEIIDYDTLDIISIDRLSFYYKKDSDDEIKLDNEYTLKDYGIEMEDGLILDLKKRYGNFEKLPSKDHNGEYIEYEDYDYDEDGFDEEYGGVQNYGGFFGEINGDDDFE